MSLLSGNNPESTPSPYVPPGSPQNESPADPPPSAPRRIPNLLHALLFVATAGLLLVALEFFLLALGLLPSSPQAALMAAQHPKLELAIQTATYLATLLIAWLFYPLVWHRSFLDGIGWRWSAARHQALKLIPLGLLLGAVTEAVTNFVTPPKTLPIDDFFVTPSTAWLITLFGTIVAPIFEEICFRGFLLPAFAIAYDWLSLPRTPQARIRWQTSTSLTPLSLLFSAILTSIVFAAMHREQLAHLWIALLLLFAVSLVLTFVRIKTRSVAASAMVHAAYNGFIFLLLLIGTGGYRHLDRMTK